MMRISLVGVEVEPDGSDEVDVGATGDVKLYLATPNGGLYIPPAAIECELKLPECHQLI